MKLSHFKQHLDEVSELNFVQPNGTRIPSHFHITEAGLTTKHFMDCGGTKRIEKTISLQIWVAKDYQHRLEPQKLKKIINLSESLYDSEDLEIEIEYQTETIGRFGLDFNGQSFMLTTKQTDCLASDQCGTSKEKLNLSELQPAKESCCTPGGSCC